ncbi:site-specific integrase [Ruegeria sp. HKCCE3926]|uniref:site-specific integrase n=1 Tax=Ruegeria sp. HKCCE3926 TaxID=2794831 RepID=UPI001AEAB9F5|nr:site-specific integrase [Ruegeria sp. HKCCE3926]
MDILINPMMAERGLRQMLSRTNNQTTKMISEIAALLRNLARILNASDDTRDALSGLAARLAVKPQNGMTQKNRSRLRVLQEDRHQQRLLLLPERVFARPRGTSKPYGWALAREDALAIAILLVCPVRVKNLADIHLERHLHRPGDGRAYLVLEGGETKNERPVEFEIPRDVLRMIDAHLKTRCPELCPAGTPWLFPRRKRCDPIDPNALSARISKRIRKETGLEMNAHLFRHFAVMNWLDANPGGYEVARRLLGHSEVNHTINMYSGLEARSATRAFADLVDAKKGRR